MKDLLARFRTVSANIEAPAGVLPGLEPCGGPEDPGRPPDRRLRADPGRARERPALRSPRQAQGTAVQRAAGPGRGAEAAARRRRDPDRPDAHRLRAGPRPGPAVARDRRDHRRPLPHPGRPRGERRRRAGRSGRQRQPLPRADRPPAARRPGRRKKGRPDRSRPERRTRTPGSRRSIAGFQQNPALARVVAQAPFEIDGQGRPGQPDDRRHPLGPRPGRRLPEQRGHPARPPAADHHPQGRLHPGAVRQSRRAVRHDRGRDPRPGPKLVRERRRDRPPGLRASRTRSARTPTSGSWRSGSASRTGRPLPEDRTYSVGLSSYIASSYAFDHKDPGRSLQSTVADALLGYLESGADLGVYTRDLVRARAEKAPGASDN